MSDLEYLEKYLNRKITEEDKKRLESEPVQYIVGNMDFYGYNFKINKNVLIPRFETELLVEKVIKYNKISNPKILDIGTGSGAIAITLEKELSKNVDAIDISKEALEVAKENNKLLNSNVNFYYSDIFSNVDSKFDIIVSNPPYIAYDEEIMDIVKNNEPNIALYADDNGLYFYKEIIKQARNYLNDKFLIAFEIGSTQKDEIISFADKYFSDAKIFCEKDYSNFDRYIFIIKD